MAPLSNGPTVSHQNGQSFQAMTIDLKDIKDIDGAIVFSKTLPAEAEHKFDREYVRNQDHD